MEVIRYPDPRTWTDILKRPDYDNRQVTDTVKDILADIRENGDRALKKYSLKYDGVKLGSFIVTNEEIHRSEGAVSSELKEAILRAKANIEKFHSSQKQKTRIVNVSRGVKCWQKSVAVEKIGIYIPGGSAPLFSTVLMLGIPAQIAGCKDIIMCTPPDKKGAVNPVILYCAGLVGVTAVFKVGGAQAIGAMAYGTETVPAVYKIFGPGNQYVTAAKQLVTMDGLAIDIPAGPSEVAVIADDTACPEFVASDLLSQAEHNPDSQVILATTEEEIIAKVSKEILKQIDELPKKDFARQSLENSRMLLMRDMAEIIGIINSYAPEHLIISARDAVRLAGQITNAGSVFIGNYTPESAGDYISGTNHTLPTNGCAKAYNGVNLDTYVRKITFQQVSKKGLKSIGPAIKIMAEAEELVGHKNAVDIRLRKIDLRK
jgi:histidinol dehydrogenase